VNRVVDRLPMTRKEHKLQVKPVKLLCLVPSQEQKQAPNPFEPSPIRLALRNTAIALENWTERFENWCDRRTEAETKQQPLSLTQRVQRLIGWSGASTTSVAVREQSLEPARGWESAMGEVIFRIRDRAGHVQRALMAQAREVKEWMAHHSHTTQTELNSLRARVVIQETQLEHLQTQLQDLRALVSSQQQVLVYMGKELDTVQHAGGQLKTVPARRSGNRPKKASKSKRRPPETGQAPYLNA
jgi:chromosome segregation ATPase